MACPAGIVSDGGGIFRANPVRAIYAALGIERHRIAPRHPWQNDIESHFNIMRRMADYHYARATTWTELRAAHDRFFADYNLRPHYAHQGRGDDKDTPAAVLGWIGGAWCDEVESDRLFRLRSSRVFDRGGYLRYKRWRIYGERGLAGQRGAVWLFGEVLTVAYGEEALAQYHVQYTPKGRRLAAVTDAHLFATRHPPRQPPLWDMADVEWHLMLPLPPYRPAHATRHRGRNSLFSRDPENRHRYDRNVYPLL